MADQDKRIVVEGVEFSELVQFPKILRAVTSSFQPQRLVLGLFMVVALITAGRLWDGFLGAEVAPEGFADQWSETRAVAAQAKLRGIVDERLDEADRPPGDEALDAREVAALVRADYAAQREALVQRIEAGEAAPQELGAADLAFFGAIDAIEDARPRGVFEATANHVSASFGTSVKGLAFLDFEQFFSGLHELFIAGPIAVWQHDWLFAVVYGLFFFVLMALGGGALARLAATETALGEKSRLQEALDFALTGWRRLIFSLLLPLLIAAVLSAVLLVGGFFLMLPWIDVIGGLLYGVALLLGFVVVFLLVGYAAGFSLLVPAVACENCDAADAQQRAYAYVLGRPLHLLGYGFVGMVSVAVGFVIASLLAVAVLNVTGALLDAATANAAVAGASDFALFDLSPRPRDVLPIALHSKWSASLVMFWQTVVVCLVAGYVFANYFSASTTIYLLMRRACDGQDLDEIWESGLVPGTTVEEPDSGDEQRGPATEEADEVTVR